MKIKDSENCHVIDFLFIPPFPPSSFSCDIGGVMQRSAQLRQPVVDRMELAFPAYPFLYAIVGPDTIPVESTTLGCEAIPTSDCNLLDVCGPGIDKTTPNVGYILNHVLATHWRIIAHADNSLELIDRLTSLGAWIGILSLVCYSADHTSQFTPPFVLGWRLPVAIRANVRAPKGTNNDLAVQVCPELSVLLVTLRVSGPHPTRCLAHLALASEIQRMLFIASGDQQDYFNASILVGEFSTNMQHGGMAATWLIFRTHAAKITALIKTRSERAIVINGGGTHDIEW